METLRRYRFRALGAVLLLCLCVPACKKDKTPCVENCPESNCEDIQGVKDYFAFKVGSWWVYEEETSGALDTVSVTQYQNNSSNYYFDVRVYSSYQDYFYHYWPQFASGSQSCSSNGLICNNSRCVVIKRSKYKSGDFVHEGNCFFFQFKKGDFSYTANTVFLNNLISVDSIYDSLTIAGLSLVSQTVKIHELNTFMEGMQPNDHYFTKGVGLVRKDLLDSNQVWNLINYHIEL